MAEGYNAPTATLHWAELGTSADRAGRVRFAEDAAAAWRRLLDGPAREGRWRFGPGVWVERDQDVWTVRWTEPARRPWADVVVRSAPAEVQPQIGLAPRTCALALDWVARTHGVDLTTSEVRVGVTRGHLLAIVLAIPLDVPGDPETLDRATEAFCERLLGEHTLDRWVVSIDVARSARRSRLSVLPNSAGASAETHPIDSLADLVQIGTAAIVASVPTSQLGAGAEPWTALELDLDGSVQGDRLQAFTNAPEALKAALEGLPFDSARFTRGPEIMMWCAWQLDSLAARIRGRATAEEVVAALGPRVCTICGSGFGARRDFLDLWILPQTEAIQALRAELAARLGTRIEIGFYDSHWALERPASWPLQE